MAASSGILPLVPFESFLDGFEGLGGAENLPSSETLFLKSSSWELSEFFSISCLPLSVLSSFIPTDHEKIAYLRDR
jgi:hypothetical protein